MMGKNIPTLFVIFGATGDLISKKIIPALFNLYIKNKLPKLIKVIGFSRRGYSDRQFQTYVTSLLVKHQDRRLQKNRLEQFIKLFSYHQGFFNQSNSYKDLAERLGNIDGEWRVCSNKLFYLAVPPHYYRPIFHHLSSSGLTIPCGPEEGWTRVIVEKPFGKNLKSAEELDLHLGKLFKEEQIYRIDHYLAKEMLQNILTFRFANNFLEQNWNNKFIEKIELRLLEKIGVEDRGDFYDRVGAFRDVGQNHLLQMLALVTMEHPINFDANSVRFKRAQILKTLQTPSLDDVKKYAVRGQYEGYRLIKAVKTNSTTETYFKVRTFLASPRWQGVPIILEGGKRMENQIKEIVVTYKHTTPCLCPPGGRHFKNKIIFQIEPKEMIQIYLFSKIPGLSLTIGEKTFSFMHRQRVKRVQYVEEYEKLLLDCIEGNQLLFVSTDEIKSMWAFADAVIEGWRKNLVELHFYKPNTSEMINKSEFISVHGPSISEKKQLGIIGLGKMGKNIAIQLVEKGWSLVGFNRTVEKAKYLEQEGINLTSTYEEFLNKQSHPRVIWLMITAGESLDGIIFTKLLPGLRQGDIIIDGANSFYKDSIRRAKKIGERGIDFVDVGFSGGPNGARYGGSLMVGGVRKAYEYLLPLFLDLAVPQGVEFFAGSGAGHFVKMIHNGIEYGMMQALAEGFTILKNSKYKLDLCKVADIYNHGSVIESRLVGWLEDSFQIYGDELNKISGSVRHTGEGEWTIKTAEEMKLKIKVIEEALQFRIQSEKNPSYTGKILTALRNQFGGHSIK